MIGRRVLDAALFLERLADEIERSRRYGRPFSLVMLRSPASLEAGDRAKLLEWGAAAARTHVRACDSVGLFEAEGMVILLLPETTASDARSVQGRFRALDQLAARFGDPSTGSGHDPTATWESEVFAYLEAPAVIEAFLRRRLGLIERDGAPTPHQL